MNRRATACNANRGSVLTITLLFIAILSFGAVRVMQGAKIDLKLTNNAAFEARAEAASETARNAAVRLLRAHISNHGGWPASVNGTMTNSEFDYAVPDYFQLADGDSDGVPDSLLGNSEEDNATGSKTLDILLGATYNGSPLTSVYLDTDISYDDDSASDEQRLQAAIKVVQTRNFLGSGSGAEMTSGYAGVGVGSATGSAQMLFELRSIGAFGNARAITASEYRHTVMN